MIPEVRFLADSLPDPNDVWLCVVFGSADRDAMTSISDIDVMAEGVPEAVAAWAKQAESALGREVNVLSAA